MASKGDWAFGQKVVEMDYSTLDRVRECVALQEKIHGMGGTPHTLAEIMLDKGYLTRTQIEAVRKVLSEGSVKIPPGGGHPAPAHSPQPFQGDQGHHHDTRHGDTTHAPQPFQGGAQSHHPAPFTQAGESAHVHASHGHQTHVHASDTAHVHAVHHNTTHAVNAKRRSLIPRIRRRETPTGTSGFTFTLLFLLVAAAGIYYLIDSMTGDDAVPENEASPTPTGPSVAVSADQSSKKDLEAIMAEQKRDRGAYVKVDRILEKYGVFLAKYQGTAAMKEGEKRRQAYLKDLANAGEELLNGIREKAKDPLARGASGEAVALYRSFPPQLLDRSPAGKTARGESARLMEEIDERYLQDKEKVDRCVSAGTHEEALGILNGVMVYIDRDRREEVERLRNELMENIEKREDSGRSEIRDEVLLLGSGIRRSLNGRDPENARRSIARFVEKRGVGETLRLLGVEIEPGKRALRHFEQGDYDLVMASFGKILHELSAENGAAVDFLLDVRNVAGAEWLLKRAKSESERAGKKIDDAALRRMTDEEIEKSAAVAKEGDAASSFALGIFLYHSSGLKSQERAIPHLERARTLGVAGVDRYLAGPAQAKAERVRRELAIARTAAERREWEEAAETLEALLRFPEDRALLEATGEVTSMLEAARKAATIVKNLRAETFADVKDLGGGLYRFSYDFAAEAQLKAFQPLKGSKNSWTVTDGMLQGKGSPAMMWKRPFSGDMEVGFDLVTIEPKNVAVNLCYRPEDDAKYYACVFGLDLLEGDVERKQGLPLNGVFKYPVNADFSRWLMPSFWEEWKRRTVGHSVRETVLQPAGRYRVAIERKGEVIRMKVDGSLIWEGNDAEYTGGQVVFSLSKSHVRIDNLTLVVKAP